MPGKAKLIQDDGYERDDNPVRREMLRHFGDGEWRSAHAMLLMIGDKIPAHLAVRAVLASARWKGKPLADRIEAGRRYLLLEAVNAAVHSKVFENNGVRGRTREYRCIKPTKAHPKVGTKLSEAEMTRPAEGTSYGISLTQVYQRIKENPDSDIDSLVALLRPCLLNDPILERYRGERTSRKIKESRPRMAMAKAEQAVAADLAADPDGFMADARRFIVRTLISGLIQSKKVTETRLFRVTE